MTGNLAFGRMLKETVVAYFAWTCYIDPPTGFLQNSPLKLYKFCRCNFVPILQVS